MVLASLRLKQYLIWKFLNREDGQDLIEYALMAGFVAVAAGAIMPGVASQISVIFSKVSSSLEAAGS
jgi:pilus assembly protein Flp/PilA